MTLLLIALLAGCPGGSSPRDSAPRDSCSSPRDSEDTSADRPDSGEPPFLNECLASDWHLLATPGTWDTAVDRDMSAFSLPVVADLDLDGIPDLLVSGFRLDVFHGLGDGTFTLAQALPQGDATPIVADVDLDGLPDIVAVTDWGVTVWYQQVDGTFDAAEDPALLETDCTDLRSLGLAEDLDGDGAKDLLLPCGVSGYAVMLAAGDGSFTATLQETHHAGSVLLPADWDLDGTLDVVYAGADHTDNHLLLGDGTGTFTRVSLPTAFPAALVVAGDFNGDDTTDLIAAGSQEWGQIDWLENAGSGAFTRHELWPPFWDDYDPTLGIPEVLATGDLDADGDSDLLAAQRELVWTRLGGPDGPDEGSTQDWFFPSGETILADLDGDGAADAISVDHDRHLTTRLGNGDGTFSTPTALVAWGSWTPGDPLGDLDGDGLSEWATGDDSGIRIWSPSPDGTFASLWSWTEGRNGSTWERVFDTDLLGDDDPEVLAWSRAELAVLDASGTLLLRQSLEDGHHARAGDVDGDGRGELILAGWSHEVLLGVFDGTAFTVTPLGHERETSGLWTGDFDGDGSLDLLVVRSTEASVWLNDGTGAFAPQPLFPLCQHSDEGITVGDLDEDGRSDIVAEHCDAGALALLLSQGDGTFRTSLLPDQSAQVPLLDDWTGDGHLDLLTDSHLLAGTGNGGFMDMGAVSAPSARSMDFDGDGWNDLVFRPATDVAPALQVLRNPCGG